MAKELLPLRVGDMRISLNDVQEGVHLSKFNVEKTFITEPNVAEAKTNTTATSTTTRQTYPMPMRPKRRHAQPFIKIMLRKTNEILLYQQRSETALRDTDEGRAVDADNRRYAELTTGSGRYNRRTRDAVTETGQILRKCREVNTETIRQREQASYVSNFEMFDTYRDLEQTTQSMDVSGGDGSAQKLEVTTYKVRGVDTFVSINRSEHFHLALMMALRILAGNVYEPQQRRFRNMHMPDPLALQVHYKYRLELLWRFAGQQVCSLEPDLEEEDEEEDDVEGEDERVVASERTSNCAVADMSWCPANGDILAVAYGSYTYAATRCPPRRGHLCVWSIKNPVNPERLYEFDAPVVSVEFCPTMPQILAVGLYDGSVQVLDITKIRNACVAVSQRSSKSPLCFEPITALAWLPKESRQDDPVKMQALLALSQDGSVTKFRLISSPHLLAFPLASLSRVDGHLEGIPIVPLCHRESRPPAKHPHMRANNHAQGLDLCMHPLCGDIYYVLSDEGCIHMCSTNYPQQHLSVLQAHVAGINVMAYSPWSPKLYLTCGNDWCIRLWIEGIFEPIVTLQNGIGPVHWAAWSETHSTILVSVSRNTVDVWDFRRSTLKPMSSSAHDKIFNTTARFSLCGRSIAVGKEDGSISMLSFEDMPFPPYFQYDQLESSIFEAIDDNEHLKRKVQSLGFLGYPGKRKNKGTHTTTLP